MRGVGLARGPDFVEEERAGRVNGTVQIVAKAAVFFARGADQSSQLGFQQRFLAFAGTQYNDECDSILREFRVAAGARFV